MEYMAWWLWIRRYQSLLVPLLVIAALDFSLLQRRPFGWFAASEVSSAGSSLAVLALGFLVGLRAAYGRMWQRAG